MKVSHLLILFLLIGLICFDIADAAKKKKKKPSKNKKPKKKRPKRPKPPTTTVNPFAPYEPFTSNATCQCWFDLSRTDCGCCINNGVQCGDPLGAWCYKPGAGGCPGITQNKYTLSQTGHPCFWDQTNLNCAICKEGSYQCGPGSKTDPDLGKNHCMTPNNPKYCEMNLADCRRMGKNICDVNASCLKTTKKLNKCGNKLNVYRCDCNTGWQGGALIPGKTYGTGLQCQDGDGNFSQDPTKVVEVEMIFTNDFYVFPHNSSEFPIGPAQDNLFTEMETLLAGGTVACSGCNATMVTFETPP